MFQFVNKLKNHGFEEITYWVLKRDVPKAYSLDWSDTAGWIYAFATSDSLKDIGMTTNLLRSRLEN